MSVKHVAYKCKPIELPVDPEHCAERPVACGIEYNDNEIVYYLPCGRIVVKKNAALFRCSYEYNCDCDPSRYGLVDCMPYQKVVVAAVKGEPKQECIIDEYQGRTMLRIECGGKPKIVLYYPSTGRAVLFSASEDCIKALLDCFSP